jgi:capsular polysaccharide biosynthesis protein
MNNEIKLEDFKLALFELWRNKILILLVTLAGIFLGLLITSYMSNSHFYTATTSVYATTYGFYQMTATEVQTMVNYSDVVSSTKVCEYAASLINDSSITADDIQNMIGMKFSDSSYVMKISATYDDPALVIKIVNAVAEAFVTEISNITGSTSIQILDEADSCYVYQSNTVNKIRLLFAGGAFVLICGGIVLKSLFSNKVRSIEQCIENEGELLGIIPCMK